MLPAWSRSLSLGLDINHETTCDYTVVAHALRLVTLYEGSCDAVSPLPSSPPSIMRTRCSMSQHRLLDCDDRDRLCSLM